MASVVAPLMRMTTAHETRDATHRATSSSGAQNYLSLNQTLWRVGRFWLQVVDMALLVNRTFPITQDLCHALPGCCRPRASPSDRAALPTLLRSIPRLRSIRLQ